MSKKKDDLIFGFGKYPHNRNSLLPTAFDWVAHKAVDDAIDKSHWRIHDSVYDLAKFNHPGGKDFLDMTKGTDITELFESSHPNIEKARALLPKYLVGKCDHPRNTATFTFEPNGFYCTLRSKVWKILEKNDSGPTAQIKLVHDTLLSIFLSLMVCATSNLQPSYDVYWPAFSIGAGFTLALLANNAHNFFHQKNNWRMYSFDLTAHSSHEWRITHAYSHHVFPNTINDYEVTAFEEFVHYLPVPKSFFKKLATAIAMIVVFNLAMIMVIVKRVILILTFRRTPRWENSIPFILLSLLAVIRCSLSFNQATTAITFTAPTAPLFLNTVLTLLPRLFVMYCSCSFWFLHISLAAGHHHPDIWHAGDSVHPTPVTRSNNSSNGVANGDGTTAKTTRKNVKNNGAKKDSYGDDVVKSKHIDWGLFQLLSVGRRPTIDASVTLASMSFGLHQLHHLFPTVDHSRLPLLIKTLEETCKEFHFDMFTECSEEDKGKDNSSASWGSKRKFSILDGYLGMLRQAMRSEPSNTNYPNFLQ